MRYWRVSFRASGGIGIGIDIAIAIAIATAIEKHERGTSRPVPVRHGRSCPRHAHPNPHAHSFGFSRGPWLVERSRARSRGSWKVRRETCIVGRAAWRSCGESTVPHGTVDSPAGPPIRLRGRRFACGTVDSPAGPSIRLRGSRFACGAAISPARPSFRPWRQCFWRETAGFALKTLFRTSNLSSREVALYEPTLLPYYLIIEKEEMWHAMCAYRKQEGGVEAGAPDAGAKSRTANKQTRFSDFCFQ